MNYLCLDFEGVLIPEIWQYVAEATDSKDLMLTTQDLKDYDELMSLRMKVVNENNIKLSDIQKIVKDIKFCIDIESPLALFVRVGLLRIARFAQVLRRHFASPGPGAARGAPGHSNTRKSRKNTQKHCNTRFYFIKSRFRASVPKQSKLESLYRRRKTTVGHTN